MVSPLLQARSWSLPILQGGPPDTQAQGPGSPAPVCSEVSWAAPGSAHLSPQHLLPLSPIAGQLGGQDSVTEQVLRCRCEALGSWPLGLSLSLGSADSVWHRPRRPLRPSQCHTYPSERLTSLPRSPSKPTRARARCPGKAPSATVPCAAPTATRSGAEGEAGLEGRGQTKRVKEFVVWEPIPRAAQVSSSAAKTSATETRVKTGARPQPRRGKQARLLHRLPLHLS